MRKFCLVVIALFVCGLASAAEYVEDFDTVAVLDFWEEETCSATTIDRSTDERVEAAPCSGAGYSAYNLTNITDSGTIEANLTIYEDASGQYLALGLGRWPFSTVVNNPITGDDGLFLNFDGKRVVIKECVASSCSTVNYTGSFLSSGPHYVKLYWDEDYWQILIDDSADFSSPVHESASDQGVLKPSVVDHVGLVGTYTGNSLDAWGDDLVVLMQDAAGDTTPPTLSNYNMTSAGGCTKWNINESDACETEDTTPTVTFNSSEDASCRIGLTDANWTGMGSGDCYGANTTSHTCTLSTAITGLQNIYIGCKDMSDNENQTTSSSGALKVKIFAPETDAETAIETGFTNSLANPAGTIYTNQQISARNLAGTQFHGTFDKVFVKGTKRWAINYINSTETSTNNLFNITPILYTLELQNKTTTEISNEVSAFINTTY